ncbi:MAG: hypothetical protein LBB53_02410 [Prevotellaceae bacterium]|nr:hypothetical protein [Prevotellaceae bacterium]
MLAIFIFSISFVNGQDLSVKGRWNIKAGYSLYKLFTLQDKPITIKDNEVPFMYKRKSNIRLEINYGVLKWLEVSAYIGLMNYEYITIEEWKNVAPWDFPHNYPDAFAPTFGIGANVQLLPLFVKNPKCKWDFYIPVRYGGCYIHKWGGEYQYNYHPDLPLWDNASISGKVKSNWNKYRHEYGAGIGGAVYIKNIVGFYLEVMGGQFSYWPELVSAPYSIRAGITAKF